MLHLANCWMRSCALRDELAAALTLTGTRGSVERDAARTLAYLRLQALADVARGGSRSSNVRRRRVFCPVPLGGVRALTLGRPALGAAHVG